MADFDASSQATWLSAGQSRRRSPESRAKQKRYASNCRCATKNRTTSYPNPAVTTAATTNRTLAPMTANTTARAAYANASANRERNCRRWVRSAKVGHGFTVMTIGLSRPTMGGQLGGQLFGSSRMPDIAGVVMVTAILGTMLGVSSPVSPEAMR